MSEKTAHEIKEDELREKHGAIVAVVLGGELYAFRHLELDEYEDAQARLRKALASGKSSGPVNRETAQLTLVHPSLDKLQAAFARWPALAGKVSDALAELGGADIEITVKKG
jgi:hypothetical protein